MKSYVEITLLANADISLYFLWEKVYQQIHLSLVEIQNADTKIQIGVSFPSYSREKRHLGSKLRLFAQSKETLENLKLQQWLTNLVDYVHITTIRDVPDKIEGYAYFKRLQLKSNNARLARRKAKREGISEELAIAYFKGRKEKYSRAPFIRMKSLSSGGRYRIMIIREDAVNDQAENGFSTYGLSSESSVPIF